MADGYEPTSGMKTEAQRGLDWREEFGRGGTNIGVSRARDITNGRALSLDTVKRMVSYFARHEVDKQGQGWSPDEDGFPSAGRIAWALWGGDPGRTWAEAIVRREEDRQGAKTMTEETRALPPSYRPSSSPDVPVEVPMCATCEYACTEVDANGTPVTMCKKWDAPVALDAYCDAWEECEEAEAPMVMMEMDSLRSAPHVEPAEPVLVDELRTLLADVVSLYLQAHGSHWNVRGEDFSQYHSLFADIYDDIYSSVDPIAENVRKLEGDAPFRLTDLASLRNVEEVLAPNDPISLANALLVANEQVLTELRSAFDLANADNEQGIANFLAERIDQHAKWSWQLRSSTGVESRSAATAWVTRSVDEKRTIAYTNIEMRAEGDGNTVVGYAALWDSPSEPLPWTEFVRRGAFTKTIKDGADVRLLLDHEGMPLARTKSGTLVLTEDDIGLRMEATLDPANPDAQRAMSALRRGDLSQMSFAFETIKDSWSKDRRTRELREVRLYDVSLVTYPAYEATVAELRSRTNTEPATVNTSLNLRKAQLSLIQARAAH